MGMRVGAEESRERGIEEGDREEEGASETERHGRKGEVLPAA